MKQLEQALKEMGLSWADVWALSLDRRAGTLVVVTADGPQLSGRQNAPRTPHDERPVPERYSFSPRSRRSKAIATH